MKLPSNATLEERERYAYIGGQVRFANVLAFCDDAEEYIYERNEKVATIQKDLSTITESYDALYSRLEDMWYNTKRSSELIC